MASQQPPTARDRLYTDCYIARMLGAKEAVLYFTRLLGIDESHLQLAFQEESGILIIVHPTPALQHVPPSASIADRPAWLLDYIWRNYGTVVPQHIWAPETAQQYRNASNMPIFFVQSDRRTLGLRLVDAASNSCEGLLNGQAASPLGGGSTTFIHVRWPGYDGQAKMIRTKNSSSAHNIPLEVLAARVARVVQTFLQLFSNQQCDRPFWRVGGQDGITENDVILIGLIQITQGTWQPILQLSHYIIETTPTAPNIL